MKLILILIIIFQAWFTSYILNVEPIIHSQLLLVKTKKPVKNTEIESFKTENTVKLLAEQKTSTSSNEIELNPEVAEKLTNVESKKRNFEMQQKEKAAAEYKKVEEEKELFWWSRQLNFNKEQEIAFSNLLKFIEDSAIKEANLNYPNKKKNPMEWFKLYYQTKEELLNQGIKEIIPENQLEKFNQLVKRTDSFQFSVLH